MSKYLFKNMALLVACAMITPFSLWAQKEEKSDKGDKEKTEKQHIIITTKGEKKEKIVVEINGDKVTVNGKPIEEYKDKNGDISVNISKLKDLESLSYFRTPGAGGVWNFNNNNDGLTFMGEDENRAMLGVTTEKVTEGAEIQSITKGSAAEKIGLKENDIITRVGDTKILGPDDLSAVIRKHKPGEKVPITYLRDKVEKKATAELTKWKGLRGQAITPGQLNNMDWDDYVEKGLPKIQIAPDLAVPFQRYKDLAWSGNKPRLGLSVQDTDDGKGVKVIEVDEESNAAKAGMKEDDIITHLDDKPVTNVDEISGMLKEKKANLTVRFQLTRNGKSQNIEVKMPRKIKTTNL